MFCSRCGAGLRPMDARSFPLGGAEMVFGNECGWLFLEQLIETPNNELIVVIAPTKQVETSPDSLDYVEDERVREVLLKTTEIVPDDSEQYRICFVGYIMYLSRDEGHARVDDDEICIGQGLVFYEKSKLLDSIGEFIWIDAAIAVQGTTAKGELRKLRHYGVYTLNNIIDVITFHEPTIEKISRPDPACF